MPLSRKFRFYYYSAGELAGLPDVAFVGAEKFSKIYITLHYIKIK